MRLLVTRRRLLTAAAVLAAVGLTAWTAWPPAPPADAAPSYDVDARPPEAIPPGAVIDRSAPPGWSHLIVKGKPRVRPDERGKTNSFTARMAEWMFTAFVADVRPDESGRHRIRSVALGLGCSVNGRDMVITPERAAALGADTGWISTTILTKGYERQRQSVVVFRGETAWLVDTPLWYRLGGKHRLVRYRYALLTDGPGGPLDVVCWLLPPGGGLDDPPAAVWLRPDTIDEAELVIDPAEFTVGVPSEAAFAVDRLPPGRPLGELPPGLREVAALSKFRPEDARALEDGVRRMLADAPH
jgi:hypothetical protein